jgi:hypothetical protein
MIYRLLADLVLVTHVAFVMFVVLGQLVILIGWACKWSWIRNFWFRLAHLGGIVVVAGQAIAGVVCPLTTWENQLRVLGGESTYPDRFVPYWLHRVLFYSWEPHVFTWVYCGFGVIVIATFVLAPPRKRKRAASPDSTETAADESTGDS